MFKRLVRKIGQIICVLLVCFTRNKSAFLRIIKYEVENYLEDKCKEGTKQVEELQNLLFHINSYLEIPEITKMMMYPNGDKQFKFQKKNFPFLYYNYVHEVEKQRAVERFCILEALKDFPFDSII